MIRMLNKLQPWGILFIRLALGSSMLHHGFQKLLPPGGLHAAHPLAGLEYFSTFVAMLGLPRWVGYVSVLTEFFGSVFVLSGLLTRLAAFIIAGNMVVALITIDRHKGYASLEYTLALISMAVLLVLTGAGTLALDRRLGIS